MQNRFNILLQERCFESASMPLKIVDVLVFSVVTLFSILARISLFPFESAEFNQYVEVWFNTIKDNGGLMGIGSSIGTVSPPYLYILAILSYLPISPLFSIKIVSCIFDLLIAFTIFRILMGISKSVKVSLCGYTAILLSPTMMLNSSAWGAFDSIYVSLILFCLFSFMKNQPFRGTIFFALAFTIKLQAIFFAPVLIVMWLKNRTRVKYFIAIPIAYVISIIPAFLGGRSLFELLILYIKTATSNSNLSTNAPNIFHLMGDISYEYVAVMGIFICGAVVMVELYLLYTKIFRFVPTVVITISLLFATTIPYFLPNMNERHFYLAEILAILLAFCRPSVWYIPLLINGASFMAYMPNLFGATNINMFYPFIFMTAGLIFVVMDLNLQIESNGARAVKNTRTAVDTVRTTPSVEPIQRTASAPAVAVAPPRVKKAPPPPPVVEQPLPTMDEMYEEQYYDDEENEYRRRGSVPASAYSLSAEALAKKIPSIADIIEVKSDPIQRLQMEMQTPYQAPPSQPQSPQMHQPPQQQYQPQPIMHTPTPPMASVISHNDYEQPQTTNVAQQDIEYQAQQQAYAQQMAQTLFGQSDYDEDFKMQMSAILQEEQPQPQYPLSKTQRLATDKSPPFSLSQARGRVDAPPPPPPPPADAPVVPKMTKSEMIAREMEEPRKNRQIPKQYLQQMETDQFDFVEENFDQIDY